MVKVKLFAYLRDGRGKEVEVVFQEGLTINKLASKLEIPKERLAITLVNGKHYDRDKNLEDEVVVYLFPPVAGG